MIDYKDMVRKQREEFLVARTLEEKKIENFAKEISKVNIEEVFGDVYIPPVISLQALCPEAYNDEPDPEVYQNQFERMCEIFDKIMNRIDQYNSEAIEFNNKFKELYSSKV